MRLFLLKCQKLHAVNVSFFSDDGKIFLGSGIGDPFGPKCHKGKKKSCQFIANWTVEIYHCKS